MDDSSGDAAARRVDDDLDAAVCAAYGITPERLAEIRSHMSPATGFSEATPFVLEVRSSRRTGRIESVRMTVRRPDRMPVPRTRGMVRARAPRARRASSRARARAPGREPDDEDDDPDRLLAQHLRLVSHGRPCGLYALAASIEWRADRDTARAVARAVEAAADRDVRREAP
jgi:hypothetical protein